jgi:hypothetical protein
MIYCNLTKLATKQETIINNMIANNNGLCTECQFQGLDMQDNNLYLCFTAVFNAMSEEKEQEIEAHFGEGATAQRMGNLIIVDFKVKA